MKTKTTKLITIALGVATMTLTAGVVFSVGTGNSDVLRSRADNTPVAGSITFDRSSTSGSSYGKTDRVFSSTTSDGNTVYMKSSNNYGNLEKTRIAAFKGTNTGDLQFYKDEGATTPYSFQNITSVSVTTYSTNDTDAKYKIMFQSNDGISYQNGSYSGWTEKTISKNQTVVYDFTAHRARYLKLMCTDDKWLDIVSITITYSCSYDYVKNNNAYYSNSAYYVVLDFDNNKYYRLNGGTLYWASFNVTYDGNNFTLEQTGTNATSLSNFGSMTRPFNSLDVGAKNTSGVIQNDGSIKFTTFTSSGTQEYTYVSIL